MRGRPGGCLRALAALAGLAVVVAPITAITTPASARPKPVPAPAHWDPRIAKIVSIVERERGLHFDHPIAVRFLADADFVKRLHADDKITKQDREDAKQAAGQLHALGLIQGQVDLIQANTALDDANTVGFYDQVRKEMVIRGEDLKSTEVRVTVAHELTHALQDQRFDLDKLDKRATSSGAAFAEQALVEGDAVWVEDGYVQRLPKSEQDAYYGGGAGSTPEPQTPADVPAALDVFSSVPYVIGPSYVYLLRTIGHGALNDAFEHPPTTDEQVLDPVASVGHPAAVHVPTPKLDAGDTRHGSPDDFGAFTLYLMLASRLDIATALTAATGWGGDRYIGFERNGRECVRADFRGDTRRDLAEIDSALRAWAATLPSDAATVQRHGETVELTSCEEPGVTAPDPKVLDEAVFAALDNRIIVTADLVDTFHTPVAKARCTADHMVSDPELEPLVQRLYGEGIQPSDLPKADQQTLQRQTGQYLKACHVG